MAVIAVIPFSAAITGRMFGSDPIRADAAASWPLPKNDAPVDDGAIYVHKKLMQVAVSEFGTPVLQFVECRHYPKQHKKLVQVGMTSGGHPVLRFVPGDYCLLTSGSAAPAALVAADRALHDAGPPPSTIDASDSSDHLTPYQRYTCAKFGAACRVALAIQFAENPEGACETYHYNSANGSLDWGFFQINTVHLTRRGLNLHDLLDCKANIDFAYQLFREEGFEPWTTYASGIYRKFLFNHQVQPMLTARGRSENNFNRVARPDLPRPGFPLLTSWRPAVLQASN